MNGEQSHSTQRVLRSLLLGQEPVKTRYVVLLAVGFLVTVSAFDYVLQVLPYGAVPNVMYGFRDAFLIDSGLGQVKLTFAPGVVVIVSLAAIHSYFNAGYLPSLLLATAPTYATFIFTVPGPVTGVVIPVGDHVVFAPVWAALHVFPNTLVFGTIGYILGIALQYHYRRGIPVPVREGERI